MPNWSYTTYYITGDKHQLSELNAVLEELEEREESLLPNDFGKTWLGNLIHRLGGAEKEITCRGSWYSRTFSTRQLTIEIESAWQEPTETRRFLEERFSGLRFYYQCVEESMEIYETNDRRHRFAPRFSLDVETADSDYYYTLQELISAVVKITGMTGITTLRGCRKALAATLPQESYALHRFRFVDD